MASILREIRQHREALEAVALTLALTDVDDTSLQCICETDDFLEKVAERIVLLRGLWKRNAVMAADLESQLSGKKSVMFKSISARRREKIEKLTVENAGLARSVLQLKRELSELREEIAELLHPKDEQQPIETDEPSTDVVRWQGDGVTQM
jgi:hypothetical protein